LQHNKQKPRLIGQISTSPDCLPPILRSLLAGLPETSVRSCVFGMPEKKELSYCIQAVLLVVASNLDTLMACPDTLKLLDPIFRGITFGLVQL